jgi:hypothetical protein
MIRRCAAEPAASLWAFNHGPTWFGDPGDKKNLKNRRAD